MTFRGVAEPGSGATKNPLSRWPSGHFTGCGGVQPTIIADRRKPRSEARGLRRSAGPPALDNPTQPSRAGLAGRRRCDGHAAAADMSMPAVRRGYVIVAMLNNAADRHDERTRWRLLADFGKARYARLAEDVGGSEAKRVSPDELVRFKCIRPARALKLNRRSAAP